MQRREFMALVGGATATWPLGALAQKAPVRLGFLFAGTANSDYVRRLLAGLTQGLTENGMTEGRDYLLETRFADSYDHFPALARELQQAKVRIIIPSTIAAVRAAQQLSPPIPVVMAAINDPVGTGLIASLAHPGGLTTGTATLNQDVTPKLLEFLGAIVPRATTLAALYNPANPSSVSFLPSLRREADIRGVSLVELAFKSVADFASTLPTLVVTRRPDALQLVADSFVLDQADRIAALASAQRLPTLASVAEVAYGGALLAYGLSVTEVFHRSAYYVKRILDGANPADLPVEQPTRIGLVINLKTAKALGITILPTVLARADEVIE
ncbi:ABC transporter substrate-binding protein [uncultured Bradyrhizobium sp.]|jgi:putative ABC transport system substrate-binding protein|uniref:ABC transporter substrate-binding protein n=1 Tax=uncultured Bradyrhizobium sp. TaxID=199684 RepID=UPI0026040EF7|nr:ABC transporter substrate-binding protein [uncultured Bradyrhizobium sp.]